MISCGRFSRNSSKSFAIILLAWLSYFIVATQARRGKSYVESTKELLSVPDMIKIHGYPVEVHHVTTEDGYIIELHRIPPANHADQVQSQSEEEEIDLNQYINHPRNLKNLRSAHPRVAVLPHCFMCNSASWVVLGSKKAIPYVLHDNGYDVWMINARGTTYARNHTTIPVQKKKFWKFGIHEMALYDVSASIDYVLEQTQVEQVDVVGYSMGIAQLFILLSEKPEYNYKVRQTVALAPSIFLGDTKAVLASMASISNLIINFMVRTHQLVVPPKDWGLNAMFVSVCSPGVPFLEELCETGIRVFTGTDGGRAIKSRLPLFFSHFPDTTSLRVMIHLGQWINTDLFKKFDFGPRLNKRLYGSIRSPNYNLDNVRIPVSIIYSEGDTITGPKGIETLRSKLGNVVEFYKVPRLSFTHWDYTWGEDAYEMVNLKVLEMLQKR